MIPLKEDPVSFGPQRDPNEPPWHFYNKDLFCLRHGNTETKKYVLSLHKIHVTHFPEDDLEEQLTRWVRKELNTFNKEAQLSIQHWKNTWHKIIYIKKHKKRSNPKEVYPDHKIGEVVRIKNEKEYGQDFMEEIILGIERYQIKINLTAPTLIIPSIKNLEPFSIITDPFIGIVYENIKKEMRVMGIREIPKFCDATLDKVMKKF
ncbi:hypothetical protein Tco_0636329 [Tanacetum coccineum]